MTGVRHLGEREHSWTASVDGLSGSSKRRFLDPTRPDATRKVDAGGLVRTIEGEIIPRLMLANRSGADATRVRSGNRRASPEDVAELARLAVAHELPLARSYVDTLLSEGVSMEAVFLQILAPAAKLLGDLWMKDLCRFTDVTVGLCHLQQLARELGPSLEREGTSQRPAARIALVPAPGEQHVFGLILLEHFCRRAGMNVWTCGASSEAELLGLVETDWLALVGVTVSNDALLEPLARFIRKIRRRSKNPRLAILVGGACACGRRGLAETVGADAAPPDLHGALTYMERHLHAVAGERFR